MNIILGFGSTEREEQQKVKEALVAGWREGIPARDVLDRWNTQADRYDKMPRGQAPSRYTRIYFFEHEGTLRFHHVNRDHAFSPDGWALLVVDEPWIGKRETEADQ